MTGVFCAVVSHPADNLVSKLNAMKGATVGDAVREMGVVGLLTRGLGLRIVMIGKILPKLYAMAVLHSEFVIVCVKRGNRYVLESGF